MMHPKMEPACSILSKSCGGMESPLIQKAVHSFRIDGEATSLANTRCSRKKATRKFSYDNWSL